MSKRFSSTAIGIFVISAIGLLVAGLLIFGSGSFFKDKREFVLFFDGSVKGLAVGAPVVFRGVEVGSVKEILFKADLDTLDIKIPVIIEIDRERFGLRAEHRRADIPKMIEKGLRAQLGTQSMVTGQLMIEFDFLPETPVRLVNADMGYPELPTVPSKLEQLAETISEIPIQKIFATLNETLTGLEKVLKAPELKDTLFSIKSAAEGADRLMRHADELVVRTDRHIDPTLQQLRTVARDAGSLLTNLERELASVSARIRETAAAATAAMREGEEAMQTVQGIAATDSEMVTGLSVALRELSAASRSVNLLAEQLEQYPDSIIRGRTASGGEQ